MDRNYKQVLNDQLKEKNNKSLQKFIIFAIRNNQSGCGAVGSVLRSGRRGRKFESSHPDLILLTHN